MKSAFTSAALLFTAAVALAACSNSSSGNKPTKGSSQTGSAARTAGQKTGGTAQGNESMATNDGVTYQELTCDDSFDGVAWCNDDQTIVFCSAGTWWALDCAQIGGDACGEDAETVDCYAFQ
jgi:hypothetical protein